MLDLARLEQLLIQQFGPFVRDQRYKQAFDRALTSLRTMEPHVQQIDLFYLFMHKLILELYRDVDKLERTMRNTS